MDSRPTDRPVFVPGNGLRCTGHRCGCRARDRLCWALPYLGTTYGLMFLAKVVLTGVLLLFGALNLKIVRAVKRVGNPSLLPLRRFAEAEVVPDLRCCS